MQESLQRGEWIDITSDLLKLPKSFRLLEVVKNQDFSLEDGMHAHEINDNKIDPKFDIDLKDSVKYMIQNKLIKPAEDLEPHQLLALAREMLKNQSQVLSGSPLHNTIYRLTYLYDSSLVQKSPLVSILIDSINNLGSYVYQLHKESCSIKEDDLNLNTYSFSTHFKPLEDLLKDLTHLENQLTTKKTICEKEGKHQQSRVYSQLLDLFRLRKALHSLAKSLGKYFDPKMSSKIEKDLSSVQKAIQTVLGHISEEEAERNYKQQLYEKGIFNDRLCKSLRSHFGPRNETQFTFKTALVELTNLIAQLQLFIPIPSRVSLLRDRIDRLHSMPLNIWSKSYIKNNIFHKEEHIFNTFPTEQVILNDINDYYPLKDTWKKEEKFQQLIRPSAPVISEVLFRYLGRSSRSFWEVSKIYEDYNILIHLANEFDTFIAGPNKREMQVASWYYNFGLGIMIRQIFSGIENQLYQHYEYPYVFYLLENLLGIYDRNSQFFLKKFDSTFQKSFWDDSLNSKKKKKVTEASRKFFSDSIFKKALHYYVRSLHRIIFVLVNRGHLGNPFEETLQTRIKNRFRIFKNVMFIRLIDFEQYKHDFLVIAQDENGYLQEAMQLLKEAKNIFQKLQGLEEMDCFLGVRKEAGDLAKICVKCSLSVMSLKMGQKGKQFRIQNNHPTYPQVVMY